MLKSLLSTRQKPRLTQAAQQQWIGLFSDITFKIRQSLQFKEILRAIVTEVLQILPADRVLIYQIFADGTGKAISEAVLPAYASILNLEFPEEVFPRDYQKLYAAGRARAIANVKDKSAGLSDCLVEFTSQFQVKAKLIVPILHTSHTLNNAKNTNQLWGLLIAHHCDRPRQWGEFELELMQQLADQISIAQAQAQLLEHLEEIVEIRTAELQNTNHNLQQEITDRIEVEEALRRSEEQLRLITNALPVLIAYVDNQQQYRFNNQTYADWLGQLPTEIYGKHLQSIWGKDCYQRMKAPVELALTGQVVTYENEIILKDGSSCSVSVTYIPHITELNPKQLVVKGFFALASDISDRKAIERMKDEFISEMSHELRIPLTSIHSALKILTTGRLGNLSTEGKQMLAIADENTERLVRLVNSVLALERIEAGAVTMEKQACNASDLMVEATKTMQPMAQQHGISLITELIDLQLWADFDYIIQALTNLLSNAIKFSTSGAKVWLTVERQTSEALFRVCDQGQGIPADKLEIIFERFQQVESSDSRKKEGSGLGLAICRKIIEQHNGKIWVESRLGQGSAFCFTLPLYISTLAKGV